MGGYSKNQGLSLRRWFYRNTRLPIFISIIAILGVESLLLVVIGKHQLELQQGVANRLAEFSRLALAQGSTSLLQAGFDIAVRDLRASRAFVCEQGWILVLKTPQRSSCVIQQKLGYRIFRVPIGSNFQFVLQVPILPQESLIYYTFGFSILVCVLGMFFLHRVSYRLERDLFLPLFKNLSGQIRLPIRELEVLRQKLLQLNLLRTQQAVASAIVERNVQVAHDIRSPLTALLFASKDFERLPGASRNVISTAIHRISAIVDSLADNQRPRNPQYFKTLKEVIKEIVAEKKLEYHNLQNVKWVEKISELEDKVLTSLDPEELKRVLSNLINNSVEALNDHQGRIEIGARNTESEIQIWVSDTGKGIPADWVSQVTTPGFSRGKAKGLGLGLSYANKAIQSVGGKLVIKPGEPCGTQIFLLFPFLQ